MHGLWYADPCHDVCVDVNECATSLYNCSGNSTCNNTLGSYTCECNDGFFGNGSVCKGKKELTIRLHLITVRNRAPVCMQVDVFKTMSCICQYRHHVSVAAHLACWSTRILFVRSAYVNTWIVACERENAYYHEYYCEKKKDKMLRVTANGSPT